jgi:hypothetical protein
MPYNNDFINKSINSMKKLFSLVAIIALTAIFSQTSFAQLNGTYTIPGSYASISAAVTALNPVGVSGPVTFNVAAGHVEQIPSGGIVINITANQPNASNPIIFQKSGPGSNPICTTTAAGLGTVTVSTNGSNTDAFFKLNGTDYITFDGIDLLDNYTGATTGPKMESGFMLNRASVSDGCKNVIIKNCRIVLALINATSLGYGIYVSQYTSAGTLTSATSIAGRHENIFIDGNTIERTITGMYFDGTTDAVAPYNLYNNNIQVGVTSANTIIAGSRTSTNTITQYGIYAQFCDSVKFNNSIIRINTGTNAATHYGIFTSTGTNSNADIIGNNVSDTINNAGASQQIGILNTFGASGTNNTVNIQNNTVASCAHILNTGAATITYIQNAGSALTINISGNTIQNNYIGNGTTTATSTVNAILQNAGNINVSAVLNINNNTVNNIVRSQSVAGTGIIYGIQTSSASYTTSVYSNNIQNLNNDKSTTSNLAGILNSSTVTGGTVNIYNNTINNLTRAIGHTSGAIYGIFSSTSTTNTNVYGNTISNLITSATASTGTIYGYYNFGSSQGTENFYNNTVFNISQTSTSIGQTYGAYIATGASAPFPTKQIYGNTFYNITGGTGQTGALYTNYASTGNIYKNKIYNITSTGTTGAPQTYGMLLQNSNTASIYNVYNNYVQEIKAPNGNPAAAPYGSVMGIWVNGGSQANIFFNTIYLDAVSVGANFGSMGLFCSVTPTQNMQNNIIINKSTPNGAGLSIAFVRNGVSPGTYSASSDRNNFYAGTPGANNLIYYDYTNSVQSLAAYKTLIGSPKDANSVTENTAFVNTAVSPYDLHISSCATNQLESNGSVITVPFAITDDFDGTPRFPNGGYPQCSTYTAIAPDIGADEFAGNQLDASSPVITYTALGNIAPAGTRSFTGVTITDASGINVTAGTKPRCYFKKSTDDNAYTGNTLFNNGWKWVESNGASSPFDFTINYGQLLGGSVNPGDVIQYFVTAQDLAGTPNIGINSGTFAGAPTSVADYANIFPLGGTINQYNISATYSGVYTVGSNLGDNFTTLTGAGGLFAALNAGVMSGNITAQITSDLTEDGANDLNTLSYDVAGANYTLRIIPADATEKVISGSVANSLIRFDGNDHVTIDGNNGLDAAGTKYLRFRNTNGLNPTISIANDSRNNTIMNCIIESNCTGTLGATATIVIGGTTGPQGNDSLFITDCDIRDNSDASGTPITAVLASGNVTYPNDYLTITGCNIYNTYNAAATFVDLYIIAGNDNVTVSGNSIYQTSTRSPANVASYFAMIFASNGSINLSNNFLGGTAPSCGGTPTTFTDGGGYLGFRLFQTSTGVASTVSGNTIANIDYSTTATTSAFLFRAIDVNGNPTANVNVTGNTVGSQLANDNIVLRYNPGAATGSPVPCAIGFGFNSAVAGYPLGSVTNNTIGGITLTGTGTTTGTTFGFTQIGIGATVNTAVTVTGNTVGGSTANSIRNTLTSTVSVLMNGISSTAITNTTGVNISNNTVRNLTNNSTATTTNTLLRGIFHSGSAGFTCSNNTVTDLNTTSGNTSGTSPSTASLVGILSTSASLNQTISQNTISGLTNSNAGVGNVHAIGLGINNSSATGTVTRNRIYDISIPNTTGGSPAIMGIDNWFGSWTISNNQVTLTNDEATFDSKSKRNTSENSLKSLNNSFVRDNIHIQPHQNVKQNSNSDKNNPRNPLVSEGEIPQPVNTDHEKQTDNNQLTYESDMSTSGVLVYGIFDDATSTQNYYYNSVYVGGSQNAGANNSAAFRKSTSSKVIYNNVFFNARTNGGTATGKHYAVISGNATINSNYNVYVSSNASTICLNNATDQTIAQWRTSTAGLDNQTWSTTSTDINASNLFSNISAGILNVNTANSEAWIVSGKGIAITGQSTDFTGDARVVSVGSGVTDIGSDEIGTLGMNTPTATVDNAPGDGEISTYTLWGRPIIRIAWGVGGSDYPTSLDVYYNSGIVPPNTLGGNFSFSHTIVNSNGPALTGATYDITYYFGDNETYTIGTPGASTILAKYGIGATWEVYHLTQPSSNSVLTYNSGTRSYNVAVAGLFDFSTFALTDDGAALPVTMESFDISVNSRDAILSWVTLSELNNKGFAVERRSKTETGYSQWKELGFVNGNGTTNERKQYTFKDAKLVIGAYQYRLRQVDYNNNIEYIQPSNNSDVIIGKPGVFDISQNYPNPSNPKSKIDFSMPFDGKVSIKVYDILGKEVASLIDEFKPADFYTVEFDGSNVASGTYFYRIIAEGNNQKFTKTMKMILVK